MMLFAILLGRVEITPAYFPQFITSLHYAFALFTVLCLLAIIASLMRGKRQPVPEPEFQSKGR